MLEEGWSRMSPLIVGTPSEASTRSARAYDRLGEGYDYATVLLEASILKQMRSALLRDARGEVLEIAVGTGKNLKYYPRGCHVRGIDVSERSLRIAKKRSIEHQLDGFAAEIADATRLPYDDKRFDTVVLTLAGCTIPNPIRVYQEMRRVCRTDGQVLILEHVQPPDSARRMLFTLIKPFTGFFLNCNPLVDSERIIVESGLLIEKCEDALDGVILKINARP